MRAPLLLLLVLLPSVTLAHPGHELGGVVAGLGHPLTGIDHLLAMLAVGMWAGQTGGSARWQLPLAFLAAMALGGLAGFTGFVLPGLEHGIAASVLLLGLLLTLAAALPRMFQLGLTAGFALLHGLAHGAELPVTAGAAGYAIGFLLMTAVLHGVGLLCAAKLGRHEWLRWGGAVITTAGAALLVAG